MIGRLTSIMSAEAFQAPLPFDILNKDGNKHSIDSVFSKSTEAYDLKLKFKHV